MSGITLEQVPDREDHFVVRFDGPGRIEVSGRDLVAFAYEGDQDDLDQEPTETYLSPSLA